MNCTKLLFTSLIFVLSFSFISCNFNIKKIETVEPSVEKEPEPAYFLISYFPNGAKGEIIDDEILSGTEVTIKQNTYEVPQDMKFAFWNTRHDGKGTSYKEGDSIKMPYYDLNLFAHWIDSNSYYIVYKNCEDADNSENPPQFAKEDTVELKAPVKEGYIFNGWYLEEDYSGMEITGWLPGEKTTSFTVYAKWTPEKRSIVYKAGYGSYDDIQFEIDYDSEIIIEDPLFIPPKNKKFLNWSLNGSDIQPGLKIETVHENMEFTAVYDYFITGDISKENLIINDVELKNTSEICIVSPESNYVVEGSNDYWSSYIWEDDHNDFKGALVEGRTISFSPFAMGKYEVTRELFNTVMGELPSEEISTTSIDENADLVAVGGINWYRAIAFCNKLTLLTGGSYDDLVYSIEDEEIDWENITLADIPKVNNNAWNNVTADITKSGYRLPTEAEWEFASRGADTTKPEFRYSYPGFNSLKQLTYSKEYGDEFGLEELNYQFKITTKSTANLNNWSIIIDDCTEEYAWLLENSNNTVHETGLLKSNSIGLHDMAGNLWEWVWDLYNVDPAFADNNYLNENNEVENPAGPIIYFETTRSDNLRLKKGSNFDKDWGIAVKASNSYRGERMNPYQCNQNTGIRVCRSLIN